MTRIKIKEIVWDEWNLEHIKKHNVTREEVEKVAQGFVIHAKAKSGRYALFARVDKRIITVIVKRKSKTIYYVVTARDSTKKERRKVYEKEKK